MKRISVTIGAVAFVMASALSATAGVTLTDLNSSVYIEDDGVYSWSVDGQSQLFQQNFYYRIGAPGSIGEASRVGTTSYTNPTNNIYTSHFTHANFNFDLTYVLMGGADGSGAADMGETVRISNTSGAPLVISFFQLSDFDLNDTPYDDWVQLVNPNVWCQRDAGRIFSETSAIPTPSHYEAAEFADLYMDLENPAFDGVLRDIAFAGPGDVMWGWQWDMTIAPGGTYIISKDKLFMVAIPSPESAALGVLGVALIALRRRN